MLSMFLVLSVLLLVSSSVFAGGGMPWDSLLSRFLGSLQGPVARGVGIIAIIATGLMFAIGEGGGWFKRAAGILVGLSLAFSASTFVGTLGAQAGGALI